MRQKISSKTVSLVFGVLVICFLVAFYVLGWTEPTAVPPGGNVPAPINVGSVAQNKLGDFGIGGGTGQPIYWLSNVGGTLRFNSTSPADTRLVIGQDGNVGIGTVSPGYKLDIAGGALRLQPSSAPTAANGVMYYDSVTNRFRCYQAGAWTDCIGAGGGDITSVIAGTGLTGGGTSGDVTLNANTTYLQRRVTGTCDPGSSIRAINIDGTVTSCEIDDGDSGGIGSFECTTVNVGGAGDFFHPVIATCPVGYTVTGGGCRYDYSGVGGWASFYITGNGYQCTPQRDASSPADIHVYVQCCRTIR